MLLATVLWIGLLILLRIFRLLRMLLFLLIVYFGVQALTGERGLLSGQARAEMLDARQTQLSAIEAEKRDLEIRVRYLRSESLSRDLLEERARAVLGFMLEMSGYGAATKAATSDS